MSKLRHKPRQSDGASLARSLNRLRKGRDPRLVILAAVLPAVLTLLFVSTAPAAAPVLGDGAERLRAPRVLPPLALPKVFVYPVAHRHSLAFVEDGVKTDGAPLSRCINGYHGVEVLSHAALLNGTAGVLVDNPDDADVMFVPMATSCFIRSEPASIAYITRALAFPHLPLIRARNEQVLREVRASPAFQGNAEKPHIVVTAQGFGRLLLSESGEFSSGDGDGDGVFKNSVLWSANGELRDPSVRLGVTDVVVPVHVSEKHARASPLGGSRPVLASFSGKVYHDQHRHSRGVRQHFLRFLQQRPELADSFKFRKTSATKGWVNVHKVMTQSKFCLAFEGWWSWTPRITEAVISGCVPVLVSTTQLPPLHRTLSFESYGMIVHPRDLRRLPTMLNNAVSSGLYETLAARLSHVQDAYDWLPPKGRALHFSLRETAIALRYPSDPVAPDPTESASAARMETPLGLHYGSFQLSSSETVERMADAPPELRGMCTLCILATAEDDGPKKDEVFVSPAMTAIKHYLAESFQETVHKIVVITTKRERRPFTGMDRVVVLTFDDVSPSTFLRQCSIAAETDGIILANSTVHQLLEKADFEKQVEAWKRQPDRIVGRHALAVGGLPGNYNAVTLDGTLVHKMWLVTSSIAASTFSPGAFVTHDCAAVTLNALAFSVSQLAPLVLSAVKPEIETIEAHECLAHLHASLTDVFLPAAITKTLSEDSKLGVLPLEKHLPLGAMKGVSAVRIPSDTPEVPEACKCGSDSVEDFVEARCQCSCVSPEERTVLASRAHTTVKGTALIMSARSDGARGRVLKETIRRYLTEPEYQKLIERVILVWNGVGENSTSPPVIDQSFKDSGQYVELVQVQNSLNNRWLISEDHLLTEAVIVQDDDIIAKPDAMAVLLQRWEEQKKERWVAAFVRGHTVDNNVMRYSMTESVSDYSIGIPRFSVLHRKYLGAYREAGEKAHFHVDHQVAHCDDILMSVAITASAGKSPLRVELPPAALLDVGNWDPGLTDEAKGNRRAQRSQCLRYLANDIFKRENQLPLVRETARLSELREDSRSECPITDSAARFNLRESVVDAWEVCVGGAPFVNSWVSDLCDLVRTEPRLPPPWLTEPISAG